MLFVCEEVDVAVNRKMYSKLKLRCFRLLSVVPPCQKCSKEVNIVLMVTPWLVTALLLVEWGKWWNECLVLVNGGLLAWLVRCLLPAACCLHNIPISNWNWSFVFVLIMRCWCKWININVLWIVLSCACSLCFVFYVWEMGSQVIPMLRTASCDIKYLSGPAILLMLF